MPELSRKVRLYVTAVSIAGIVLLIRWTWSITFSWKLLGEFPFWASLAILAELGPVALPQGGFVTLGFPISFAVLLIYGPGLSSWVAVCGTIVEAKRRKKGEWYVVLFDQTQLILSISAAWIVYQYMGGEPITSTSLGHILPIVASALAYFLANTFLVNTVLALEKGISVLEMWSINFKWTVPNYLAQTPLGFLMAVLYRQISWWAVLFLCFPLFIAYYAYKLYAELRRQHLSTIQALATAIEMRDSYTEDHSMRMAELAVATARELRVPASEVEVIRYAAILHDIGKIGVSDQILNKPAQLTEKEWAKMREHPKIGMEIVSKIDSLKEASRIVYYHHEWYNGQGYPEGLKGEDIPIGARILAVVDAYDAMTSKRPYRSAYPVERAIEELRKNAGTQFDGKVVEAFLKILKSGQNVT